MNKMKETYIILITEKIINKRTVLNTNIIEIYA